MILSLLLCFTIFGEEYLANFDPVGYTIRITKNTLRIAEDDSYDVSVSYKFINEGGLTFIEFVNPEKGFPWIKKGPTKLLSLISDAWVILYEKNNQTPVFEICGDKAVANSNEFEYSASSELKENNNIYKAQNLATNKLDSPWVDSSRNAAKDQYIIISGKGNYKISCLYFSNGFVSFNKPYLYNQNNRIKSIEILDELNQIIGKFELQDTPSLQQIYWDKGAKKITIKILDVFPGNKYNDTCVNYIIPDRGF
jgi:hypothetical protein